MEYDVTELTGLDDLHDVNGVIAEARIVAQKYMKQRKVIFL